ncbi:Basic-leucine zipper domain [Macleaya cordata]|uniref:Basic-leucine zipper domain n=1 Tax=Macleaya cordata TaxID=56857 RepID=A0A200QD27_MACCD|nr:Basic-leucine zipper domain [Macleaya cordata]
MFPLFSTSEDPKDPFQFYMPTLNHDQPQFQNARLLPNMITSSVTSTMEGLANFENFDGFEDNNGMVPFKRQRALEETPTFFIGDGSGSSQFEQLNGIGNVLEPMRSGGGFGVGTSGLGFYNQYYPYQVLGTGFKVGTANEPNNNLQSQLVPENFIDSVVERRHRRMIKNRESAARSRARRLAYNAQLVLEIEQLKKENESLRQVFEGIFVIANMKNEKLERGIPRITSSTS